MIENILQEGQFSLSFYPTLKSGVIFFLLFIKNRSNIDSHYLPNLI